MPQPQAQLSITFVPTEEGIASAIKTLEKLRPGSVTSNQAPATPSSPSTVSQTKQVTQADNRAVTLYKAMADKNNSRSPLFLEALTTTPQNFDELSPKVRRPHDSADPSAASVRAVFRNIRRTETWLLDHGLIDENVVRVDDSKYGIEGACRYYLTAEDRSALDEV